jgi:hypothetical protein
VVSLPTTAGSFQVHGLAKIGWRWLVWHCFSDKNRTQRRTRQAEKMAGAINHSIIGYGDRFKNRMRPVHPGEVLQEDFLKPLG